MPLYSENVQPRSVHLERMLHRFRSVEEPGQYDPQTVRPIDGKLPVAARPKYWRLLGQLPEMRDTPSFFASSGIVPKIPLYFLTPRFPIF